jgi:hypothetical protein
MDVPASMVGECQDGGRILLRFGVVHDVVRASAMPQAGGGICFTTVGRLVGRSMWRRGRRTERSRWRRSEGWGRRRVSGACGISERVSVGAGDQAHGLDERLFQRSFGPLTGRLAGLGLPVWLGRFTGVAKHAGDTGFDGAGVAVNDPARAVDTDENALAVERGRELFGSGPGGAIYLIFIE